MLGSQRKSVGLPSQSLPPPQLARTGCPTYTFQISYMNLSFLCVSVNSRKTVRFMEKTHEFKILERKKSFNVASDTNHPKMNG